MCLYLKLECLGNYIEGEMSSGKYCCEMIIIWMVVIDQNGNLVV